MVAGRHGLYCESALLPSGYRMLDWVDCDTVDRGSTSGQPWGAYAMTDIAGLTRDTWGLDAYAVKTSVVGEWTFLAGSEYSDNQNGFIKIRLCGGTGLFEQNSGSGLSVPCDAGMVQHVVIGDRIADVNGVRWTVNSSNVVNDRKLCLGGAELVVSKYDGYKRTWPGLIGRAKVFSDHVLVGDFVPAKRTSDGICGFYCLVANKFYLSSNPAVPFKEGALA